MTNNIIKMPTGVCFPNIRKNNEIETNISNTDVLATPFEGGTSCLTAKSERSSRTKKSPAVEPQQNTAKFLYEYSNIETEYHHDTIKWGRFTLWENKPGKYVVSAAFNWDKEKNKPELDVHFSLKGSYVRFFTRFGQGYEHLKKHQFYTEQKDYVAYERRHNWKEYEVSPRLTKGYLKKTNAGTKSVEFSSFLLYKRFDRNYFEGLVRLGWPDTFEYYCAFDEEPSTLQRNATNGKALGVAWYRPLARGRWKNNDMFNGLDYLKKRPQLKIVGEEEK